MIRFLLKIAINAVVFFLIANYFFALNLTPGHDWKKIGLAGLILGVINYIIR